MTVPSCERCWADSRLATLSGDDGAYQRLLEQRGPSGCTPEQQAGPDARKCPICQRMTVHQHVGECMVSGCGREEP